MNPMTLNPWRCCKWEEGKRSGTRKLWCGAVGMRLHVPSMCPAPCPAPTSKYSMRAMGCSSSGCEISGACTACRMRATGTPRGSVSTRTAAVAHSPSPPSYTALNPLPTHPRQLEERRRHLALAGSTHVEAHAREHQLAQLDGEGVHAERHLSKGERAVGEREGQPLAAALQGQHHLCGRQREGVCAGDRRRGLRWRRRGRRRRRRGDCAGSACVHLSCPSAPPPFATPTYSPGTMTRPLTGRLGAASAAPRPARARAARISATRRMVPDSDREVPWELEEEPSSHLRARIWPPTCAFSEFSLSSRDGT